MERINAKVNYFYAANKLFPCRKKIYLPKNLRVNFILLDKIYFLNNVKKNFCCMQNWYLFFVRYNEIARIISTTILIYSNEILSFDLFSGVSNYVCRGILMKLCSWIFINKLLLFVFIVSVYDNKYNCYIFSFSIA